MVTNALQLSGIELSEDDARGHGRAGPHPARAHPRAAAFHIPNDVSPPYHFSPVVSGMRVDRAKQPWVMSKTPALKRPANLEDVAFGRYGTWPSSSARSR